MSRRTTQTDFNHPNTAGNDIVATRHGILWEDTAGEILFLDGAAFNASNCVIQTAALTTDTDAVGDRYNLNNVTVIFSGGTQDEVGGPTGTGATLLPSTDLTTVGVGNATFINQKGNSTFENCSFIRDDGSIRIVMGVFDDDPTAVNNLVLRNNTFMSTDSAAPFVLYNSNLDTLVNEGTNLQGAAVWQCAAGFTSVGTIWGSLGAEDGGAGQFVSSTNPYFLRAVHFLGKQFGGGNLPDSNINTTNGQLPANGAIFLAGDDMSVTVANNRRFQLNRNAGALLINCATGGNEILPSFHGAVGNLITQSIGVYQIVGWKPVWTDSTDNQIVTDVRMALADDAYPVEAIDNNLTTFFTNINSARVFPNTVFDLDADDNDYRGLWVETANVIYNTNNPTLAGTANIPAPANSTYQAKSFSHDLSVFTATAIPTRTITNANGDQDIVFGSVSNGVADFVDDIFQSAADPLVGAYTATTAPTGAVTTLDDAYAGLKRNWYDRADFQDFAITGNGSIITLNSNWTISATIFAHPTNGNIQIRSTAGLEAGTLINTIVATGRTIDLNGTRLPSNTTIDGGTWDDISNDVTGVTFAATGETPIVFIAFDNITGWDFTGAAELRSTTPRTVSLTADQATELGVTDGQVVGNITYDVATARPNFTVQLDEVRAGMVYIYDVTGDTVVTSRILTGSESDTTITLNGGTYADSNQFYAFYWPDSTLEISGDGTAQNVYRPQPVTWNFSDGNQVLSPETIAAVLEDSATGILSGQGFTTSNSGSGATTQTTITITGANTTTPTGAQSLSAAILIHNDQELKNTFAARREMTPYLGIGLNNGTIWRDDSATYANSPFRFQSGQTTTTTANVVGGGTANVEIPAQQIFSNWSNQVVRTDRGVTEVASIPEGSLTSQQAQQALGGTIDSALSGALITVARKQDVANAANTGQVFNTDGTVVSVNTTPTE